MTIFILFVLGVFIGSFLNVVSLRYQPGKKIFSLRSIGGRSACRTCQIQLKWYELVPLFSFLVQGFRCRHCRHSLSWQYPIVEAVTGLLTATIPLFFYHFLNIHSYLARSLSINWYIGFIILWLLVAYTLVVITVIDFRHKIIPDQANILLLILGIGVVLLKIFNFEKFKFQGSLFHSYRDIFGFNESLILSTLVAVGVAVLLFGGIILLTKGRGMGMGDLKLAIPLAILLGWPDVILAFVSAFILGSLFGITLILHKAKNMKDKIPFGPFIAIGVFVAIFYGERIVRWYFSLI